MIVNVDICLVGNLARFGSSNGVQRELEGESPMSQHRATAIASAALEPELLNRLLPSHFPLVAQKMP